MREIKISGMLEKMIKDRQNSMENEKTSDMLLSTEKANEILKQFGFNESDNVDIDDFFQFSKYFGFNKEVYLAYRTLKKDADVSWEDIKNIKWEDVDLEKGTIRFPNQKIKTARTDR